MKKNKNINRRKFLKTASAMAAGAIGFPYIVPSSALGKAGTVAPSNRISVGAIGVGEQGNLVLGNFLNQDDAQVIAVCDVDKGRREGTCQRVDQHYQKKGCAAYNDFRELLGRDDIDAVLIATPDHWHVLCATAAAKAGKGLPEVVEEVKQVIPDIHLLFLLDTLKYLLLGGRIGKAKALLGSILNVKPMLALKDGEVMPAGQVRTRSKGIERLIDFVKNATDIQDLAIVYNTTPDEAQTLAERIGSIFTTQKISLARVGPMLGVHAGPGALAIALRGRMIA